MNTTVLEQVLQNQCNYYIAHHNTDLVLNVFEVISLVLSLLMGVLSLAYDKGKIRYPSTFVAWICFSEAYQANLQLWLPRNPCERWPSSLLSNMLLNRGSTLSNFLGFSVCSFSENLILSLIVICQSLGFIFFAGTEVICMICIAFDVALTTRNSINRLNHLEYLRKGSIFAVCVYLVIMFSLIGYQISKLLDPNYALPPETRLIDLLYSSTAVPTTLLVCLYYSSVLSCLLYLAVSYGKVKNMAKEVST